MPSSTRSCCKNGTCRYLKDDSAGARSTRASLVQQVSNQRKKLKLQNLLPSPRKPTPRCNECREDGALKIQGHRIKHRRVTGGTAWMESSLSSSICLQASFGMFFYLTAFSKHALGVWVSVTERRLLDGVSHNFMTGRMRYLRSMLRKVDLSIKEGVRSR